MERAKTLSGETAGQFEIELSMLIDLAVSQGVRSYLEIGARHGDTFHRAMSALPKGSAGVAVDMPGGLWGKPKTDTALNRRIAELNGMGYNTRAVYGDSHSEKTVTDVSQSAPFDLVFIDADHTYEAVKKDWELYCPMAKLVAFHDIVGHGQKCRRFPVEVPRLWAEIAPGRRWTQFIAPGSKMGIGVIFNPPAE